MDDSSAERNTEEQWRPVAGYEGLYEVSDLGRVKSYHRWRGQGEGRLLALPLTHYGYPAVKLCREGVQRDALVHRLLAAAFIGPCPPGKEVNHIDGVKTNARVTNLEYVTDSEQRQHAYDIGLQKRGADHFNAKLNPEKVAEIRALRGKVKGRELAARLGISPQLVCDVQKGRRWSDSLARE